MRLDSDKKIAARKDRRSFLKHTGIMAVGAAGASTLGLNPSRLPAAEKKALRPIIAFTKAFQAMSYEELAAFLAEQGIAGAEFPLRLGGHIEPDQVEVELPKAVKAFEKEGVEITMLATGINEVSREQHTERVLKTAADLGISKFRMAYYRYSKTGNPWDELEATRPKFDGLIELSSKLGVQPLYHNHSGDRYVGAGLWDLFLLLKDHDPKQVGWVLDIGHALIEGVKQWPRTIRLLKDYIEVVNFKAPSWSEEKQSFVYGPLKDGIIPHAKCLELLQELRYQGPWNLHMEYVHAHKDPALLDQAKQALELDMNTLRSWLG